MICSAAPVAIWNPASGSAPSGSELSAALPEGVRLVETTIEDPGTAQASKAAADGAEAVIACGGDGTIRACLEGVAGTDTPLGIVALGTGNILALNLGVEAGLDAAGSVLDGTPGRIDLGRANGEAFAVMAGTGFDAEMMSEAEQLGKGRIGRAAYVLAAIKTIPTRLAPTKVSVDGSTFFEGRTSMVLIGNVATITGGLEVFPDGRADDGLLDVGVLRAKKVRDWCRVVTNLVLSRPQPGDLVERTQARSVMVECEQARAYQLDGEPRDPVERLEVEIEPDALLIHRPPSSPEEASP